MDISVSRLNQRMALQLPAELPLGLVFVVGEVQLPKRIRGATQNARATRHTWATEFYLGDEGYRLPCRLSERAATEFRLEEGDMVRAGGHLVFEPALASYYLLARDIERLDGYRPVARPLAAIIADSNRREAATSVTQAELPAWVQQMAPPEVRSGQAEEQFAAVNGPPLNGDWELLVDAQSAVAYPEAEPALAGMSDELIAFLSQAMDSEVEVELTPEIMTDFNTTGTTDRLSTEILEALDLFETSISQEVGDGMAPEEPEILSPESQMDADLSPLEIYLTWAEQGLEQDTATDESLDSPMTAAEMAFALENAGPPATPVAAAQPAAQSAVPERENGRSASRKANSGIVVPWYLAILVIILVVILAAFVIYLILFAGDFSFAPSLDLPDPLSFLN